MDIIFQIPGYIAKITTIAKNTIRLQIDSQENVSGEVMKRAFDMIDQLGWFTFNIKQIQPEDLINLPELKPADNQKTPAQRKRAIIFRMWEQNNGGFKDSESHYYFWMEKIANWLKQNLK